MKLQEDKLPQTIRRPIIYDLNVNVVHRRRVHHYKLDGLGQQIISTSPVLQPSTKEIYTLCLPPFLWLTLDYKYLVKASHQGGAQWHRLTIKLSKGCQWTLLLSLVIKAQYSIRLYST